MNNAFVCDKNTVFNYVPGNREVIDQKHVRSIMNAMSNGEFIPPIIVDRKTNFVVDGQHRNEARMYLLKEGIVFELGVIYADFDNPLLAAIMYNNKRKEWRIASYVKAYIHDNRESYKLLHNFCATHSLFATGNKCKYSSAIILLTHMYDTAVVRNGDLVLTQEQCNNAEMVYNEIVALSKFINCITDKSVLKAWIVARAEIIKRINMQDYIMLAQNKLVPPASFRIAEWHNVFLKVLK